MEPSTVSRLEEFRSFWDTAIAYQARRGVARSPAFPEAIITAEIGAHRHFSALRDDGVCIGFFSVTLQDKGIWRERDRGDGIYLHRMCVNPHARGEGLAAAVLNWAHGYARECQREYVRMDTWGDNDRLISHYRACGYRLIGFQEIGDEPSLPAHYHGIRLALFENEAWRLGS